VENVPDCFDAIIQKIVEKLEPERIILFGSRAKGTNRKGSDIDLAVVGGKTLTFRELRHLKEELDTLGGLYSVDLVLFEKVDEKLKKSILDTGVDIYEKNRPDHHSGKT